MAKTNRRPRVPKYIADTVLYESDLTCCICRRSGRPIQIHHLDGVPSNNTPGNLAVLCLEHHNDASSRSFMARNLSAGVIARYRDEWHTIVRTKRESSLAHHKEGVDLHEAYMEALACHDVRKFSFDLDGDWKAVSQRIGQIHPFVSSWEYGDRLRAEVLNAMYHLAGRTRHGMPFSVASEASQLASRALPIVSLVRPTRVPPDEKQKELLRSGMDIGFSIAYDRIKYIQNLSIMASGASLLRTVLRYAHLNKLEDLKAECLNEFDRLIEEAKRANDEKSRIWLEFERDDALALDDENLPAFPSEVANEIMALQD